MNKVKEKEELITSNELFDCVRSLNQVLTKFVFLLLLLSCSSLSLLLVVVLLV